jgi:CHAT domain-containing protein/Flp pilus assembly protein TadD
MRIQFIIFTTSLLFVLSGCLSICELANQSASAPGPSNIRRREEAQLNRGVCDPTEDLTRLVEAGENALFKAEYSLATRIYICGLQLAEQRGDLAYVARYLYLLARARAFFGNYDGALEDATKSLEIARGIRARLVEAEALRVIAGVHQSKGEYAQSLVLLRDSLQIAQEIGDGLSEAKTRNALGQVYGFLGWHQDALENYKKALSGFRAARDRRGEGIMLHNLGVVYRNLGEDRRALQSYDQALSIRKELDDPQLRQETLQNIGAIYMNHGCYIAALRNYEHSLAVTQQIGHRLEEGRTHYHLGVVYYKLGRFEQALRSFQSALAIQSTVNTPELQWRVWHGLSSTYAQLSRPGTAIFLGKQAVNVLQTMRSNLTSLDPVLQSSFLVDKARAYKDLANLLIGEGRFAEAQQVLDLLKEKEYLDYTRAETQARAKSTEFSTPEERAADEVVRWVELGKKRGALLEKKRSQGLTVDEEEWIDRIGEVIDSAYIAFITGIDELEAEYRKAERKELKSLVGFQETLQKLGEDVVCIYFLSTDKLRIVVTVSDIEVRPFYRDSSISERELNRLVFDYRQTLQDPSKDPLPQAKKLYDYLLKPIEKDLESAKAKTLLVYLDGALRYLPLPALHDGRRYVAERYGVVIYTAAAKDKLLPGPAKAWQVAGMGVSEGFAGFNPLPAVEEELDEIVREASEDSRGVLPGVRFLNREFSKARLSSVLHEKKYQVVHLASHFYLSPGTLENSFLLLGRGERLNVEELRSVKFPLTQVDLLTLSACETGLGTTTVKNGHEVESFGALAQEQGAKSVIATLWNVADRSTGQFLQLFYSLRELRNLSKAEALRRAQQTFIEGDPRSLADQQQHSKVTPAAYTGATNRYSHPYYWAPFILMGNWQ